MLAHSTYLNLFLNEHPIVADSLSWIRNENSQKPIIREHMGRIALFLGADIFEQLKVVHKDIKTPVTSMRAPFLAKRPVIIVSVLGAGLAFSEGLSKNLLPKAEDGMIALSRDDTTLEVSEHYTRLPADLSRHLVVVCEPMCATGKSTSLAVSALKARGAIDISVMALMVAPEGVSFMQEEHPDVQIHTASLDVGLTEKAYITPGGGDIGDRMSGVKPT